MIRPKKILLMLYCIPMALYILSFYINWRAALCGVMAAIFTTSLSDTWKDYDKEP